MRLIICDSRQDATARTVAMMAATVADKPDAVLGLATGGTMEKVYAGLIAAHRRGLSFADVTSFNLDEYVGLAPDHPQSYRRYMQRHLFDHLDIDPARTFIPRGDAEPEKAAADFEARIAAHGPIDLQLLGLGRNGHIGFNEPGSSLRSRTREKVLTRSTRQANARFFNNGEEPPQTAVTMGIGTIMDASAIVLLALGEAKAEAVARAVEGSVTAMCPGSVLQFHTDATVIVDTAAAQALQMGEHYREVERIRAARLTSRSP